MNKPLTMTIICINNLIQQFRIYIQNIFEGYLIDYINILQIQI